ncbi:MAG: oligosaccharide flippase family protein [Candidatus Aenigmarchaeota archaeon]|nr:oligosaccharide flippase family protein [Candidatus Aenigmarchaeota archaeon]
MEFLLNEVKKEKELVKDSLIIFIANGGPAIINFAVNLMLAKIFIPESFGIFKNITYLLTFFSSLMDFGSGVTLTKYIAQFRVKGKEKIGYMSRWFLKLRLIVYSVLFIGLFIFIKPIAVYFLHDASLSYLVIFGLSIVFANIFSILPSMVIGYENFKLFLVSRMTASFGSLIFGVGLGYFFGLPYAIIGFGFSNLLANIICLKFLSEKKSFSKDGGSFNLKKIFLKFSLPMYIFSLPSSFGSAIVPLLSLFFSMDLIGQYSFSFLFYAAGLVIPGALATILLPKFSRLNALKNDKKIRGILMKVFFVYTVIVIGGIAGTLLFGEAIISIIAPQYLPGILFFKALISLGLVSGYLSIFESYLTSKEMIKEVALVVLAQNILLFLVSYILLKNF